ncbi:hypothetical protein CDL12_05677 [Handroanthus impetiginosus]|uniref:Uncharacterized protein n=1 Tax=Handroanthus impetiginosus TaxID=429701 RepID=A0A2G9HVS5_9LAMI|nr:hypothetical protein CDL12_05677 [Handroanthus impetiginosus]
MEKYFKRKSKVLEESSVIEKSSQEYSKCNREVINFENLPPDPGLRKKIINYHPNDREEILRCLLDMFSPMIDLFEFIMEDGVIAEHRAKASSPLDAILSFDFVFKLHLIWKVLGIINELSQALQRKDQDIVNAMKLVKISKEQL